MVAGRAVRGCLCAAWEALDAEAERGLQGLRGCGMLLTGVLSCLVLHVALPVPGAVGLVVRGELRELVLERRLVRGLIRR